jgi:putative ABC transport system substrate-binding protein
MGYAESDPLGQKLAQAFGQTLEELGWKAGQNVLLDYRWAAGNIDRMRMFANELVAWRPDVILANTTPVTAAFHQLTRTIPVVFVVVSDPVGEGFVTSLSRPGGNITGFLHLEASVGGKWLGLLKEVVPQLRSAAIMLNPDTAPDHGNFFLPAFETAAQSLGVQSTVAPVRSDPDIEAAIASLANETSSGLVIQSDGFVRVHRQTIIASTARYKIPAVYPLRVNAVDGGLMAYGPSYPDLFRRAAEYVDRILRGTKPEELPVQEPTKFELVINLKTAKALGITFPPSLLSIADEVIGETG